VPLYYPDILDQEMLPRTFTYTDKDVILYALGVGMGADPMNRDELPFVYEKGLRVIPTAATVLAGRGNEPAPRKPGHRESVPNMIYQLHGEQRVELHRPLPPEGTFTTKTRVIGAFDKGKDKGAVVVTETAWTDEAGERVVTLTSSQFNRADGGFGGPSTGAPEPHVTPDRAPDLSIDYPTRPDQALLYRLNGDRNPLHSDPDIWTRAGFDRPVLHGLCTYGMTCRAVLQMITGFDPDRIASHQVRFASPVFPGETVTVDLWRDDLVISFEARVKARDVTVVKAGKCVLRS
jgi:acyl dehydratase